MVEWFVKSSPVVDRRSPRGGVRTGFREFFYGLSGYEFERLNVEMRGALETLFLTVTVGNLVGVPVIPAYYSLRLLPFIVPQVETWKRRVLREREFSDAHEYDLHGV